MQNNYCIKHCNYFHYLGSFITVSSTLTPMNQRLKQTRLRDLLILIASDDLEALGEFFRRYHAKMMDFAKLLMKSPTDAEEVVSSVSERLLKNRKRCNLQYHLNRCIV